jgi:large subunit ribosomal protein L19e
MSGNYRFSMHELEETMDLRRKKALAARTFGVGTGRILFNHQRLGDIKEAITKQDMRDLLTQKAIMIREVTGRHSNPGRVRRRAGSIRKRPNNRKREYIMLTRKLRAYVSELRGHETITKDQFLTLRKEIRGRQFKNKTHLKERVTQLRKEQKHHA